MTDTAEKEARYIHPSEVEPVFILGGKVYHYSGEEDWSDDPAIKLDAVCETLAETWAALIRASGFWSGPENKEEQTAIAVNLHQANRALVKTLTPEQIEAGLKRMGRHPPFWQRRAH